MIVYNYTVTKSFILTLLHSYSCSGNILLPKTIRFLQKKYLLYFFISLSLQASDAIWHQIERWEENQEKIFLSLIYTSKQHFAEKITFLEPCLHNTTMKGLIIYRKYSNLQLPNVK